eukprot:scaffold176222_cov29-Tisochrysis_lutea.AAC.7
MSDESTRLLHAPNNEVFSASTVRALPDPGCQGGGGGGRRRILGPLADKVLLRWLPATRLWVGVLAVNGLQRRWGRFELPDIPCTLNIPTSIRPGWASYGRSELVHAGAAATASFRRGSMQRRRFIHEHGHCICCNPCTAGPEAGRYRSLMEAFVVRPRRTAPKYASGRSGSALDASAAAFRFRAILSFSVKAVVAPRATHRVDRMRTAPKLMLCTLLGLNVVTWRGRDLLQRDAPVVAVIDLAAV